MFCCHSARRRETILASLSGCATIAGVSPDGPGPIRAHCRDQHAVAGRFDLERPCRADALGSDDVVHPAALVLDFDDLADGRPVPERLMLVAAAKPRTDFNRVGVVDPLNGLQLGPDVCHWMTTESDLPRVTVRHGSDVLAYVDSDP